MTLTDKSWESIRQSIIDALNRAGTLKDATPGVEYEVTITGALKLSVCLAPEPPKEPPPDE